MCLISICLVSPRAIVTTFKSETTSTLPSYTKYGYQKMKIPVELHDFILQGIKQTSSRLVNEPCAPNDPFHNCQRVKDDGTLGNKYGFHFFHIFIFHQKRKKKSLRNRQNCIFLNQYY